VSSNVLVTGRLFRLETIASVVPLFATVALLHCSDGSSSGGGPATSCPSTPPTADGPCAAPAGTTCNYATAAAGCECCPGGGSTEFQCTGGKWVELVSANAGNGAPAGVACPETVPKQGDACGSPCGGAVTTCNYDCAHGNGFVSTAKCQGGSWQVTQSEVACEIPDSGLDGSDSGDSGDAAHD
jgi:hypothetical protein